jgi:hypothetical protein
MKVHDLLMPIPTDIGEDAVPTLDNTEYASGFRYCAKKPADELRRSIG